MAKKEIIYNNSSYTLSYDLVNPNQTQAILFLHGWGSNKEIMKQAFSHCFPAYKHIYLDLPGFGKSSIDRVIETSQYALVVQAFLDALHVSPLIIFGHSFGGKVATLLSPQNLVLLSSAGIVVPKPLKVKIKIALFKIFKPFFPKSFYRFFATKDVEGMSQTMYEILKCVVNEDFQEIFARRRSPTYLFWGKLDTATPLESGELIHKIIPNSHFFPLDGDHFFFLKQSKTIENLLVESGF